MNSDLSKEALELLNAIDKYMEATMKKDCPFTETDYINIKNMIAILEKHLELLADYEEKQSK